MILILLLQQAKQYDRAREAFEKAATGHQRQGSHWHSAKLLEKAADMAKECTRGAGSDVEALYRDAARGYMEAGRTTAAAEALARAALHLEGIDAKVLTETWPMSSCCIALFSEPQTLQGCEKSQWGLLPSIQC